MEISVKKATRNQELQVLCGFFSVTVLKFLKLNF